MLKCLSMKNWVKSKPPINIVLFLLYLESCSCFKIDRHLHDTSDLLNANNCDGIQGTHFEDRRKRCKCTGTGSIVSINTGRIQCLKKNAIDSGKYTSVLLYSVFFSLRNIVTMSPLSF